MLVCLMIGLSKVELVLFPEHINWDDDGYYRSVVVIKAKNYILLPHDDDKLKIKGSATKDSKKEPALKEMMANMVDAMVYNRLEEIPLIYKKYVQEAMNVTDIMRWSTKKTISDKVLAGRNPKADVRKQELDVWKAIQHEDDTQEGIDRLTKEINSLTPELINWEFEFYIPRIITIKSKNYVLDYGNEVKTKGSSLRDQKKEPAMKELMNNLIGEMLGENNIDTLVLIYKKYVQEAMNVTDIMRWSTKKTFSDKVLAGRNPKADVRKQERDVWKAIQHEDDTQEGNKVHLYPVTLVS